MVASCVPLLLAASLVLLACRGTVEACNGPCPPEAHRRRRRRRRRQQLSGSSCPPSTDECNDPCGNAKPEPDKPDGGYNAIGAVEALAAGGFSVLRSKFFDAAISASGWGYIGAGVLDGVVGAVEAGEPDKAAWNVYKLESFISGIADYVICEVRSIVGQYFQKYMDFQDLCHYNIGINAMADVWLSTCHSRQCLNLTSLPADLRGDCCSASVFGNSDDCQSWSDEQIAAGQGLCRLQEENFRPGTGVCSTDRVCRSCMDIPKAIEMTQAQIDSYKTSPTNWGEALQGYSNVDAVIAQSRGTMMMVSYYQELILLGGTASIGNFQLFSKSAHQQMQSKIDSLMSSAPSVVSRSSCTLLTPPQVVQFGCCSGCCNDLVCSPCTTGINDFCLYVRTGCKKPYSMVGTNGCVDLGQKFCGRDPNCTICTQSRGCNKLSCYDDMNNDNRMGFCFDDWSTVWENEKEKATMALKAQYAATLANVSRFLDILENYSKEPLSSEVFGAYVRLGYRRPSCDANTASHTVIAQCQQGKAQSKGFGLPHSHFRP